MSGARVDELGRWVWETWRDGAACRNADPALFYSRPGEGAATRRMRVNACKRLCAACPVRDECLRFAHENGESSGVWGGLTGEERAQRRIAARQQAASLRQVS